MPVRVSKAGEKTGTGKGGLRMQQGHSADLAGHLDSIAISKPEPVSLLKHVTPVCMMMTVR